jgi:hypothetical protein
MKPMPNADENRRLGEIEKEKADKLPPGVRQEAHRKKRRAITNQALTQTTGLTRTCTSRRNLGLYRCCERALGPFGRDGFKRVNLIALQAAELRSARPVRHCHQSFFALRTAGHIHEKTYGVVRLKFKKRLQSLVMYRKIHRNQTQTVVFSLHE